MPSAVPDSGTTPEPTAEALLAAASEIFAEKGLGLARVRDIATRAGANVAAISYHFGGKQALYREVLRRQARARISRYPMPDATSSSTQEPERLLAAAIQALLGRFLADDGSALMARLMVRELAAPTPALTALIEDVIHPQYQALSGIVARLLGTQADAQLVQRATFSVISQCIFYLFARPLVTVLAPQTYDDQPVPALAAHITGFSLAALRTLRMQLEEASDA